MSKLAEWLDKSKCIILNRPSAEKVFDELADDYDSYFGTMHALAEDEALFDIFHMWRRGDSKAIRVVDERVLDVGCGTGLFLDNALIDPCDYEGIDVSERMLQIAKSAYPDHDWTKLNFNRIDRDLSKDPHVGGGKLMASYPYQPEIRLDPAELVVSFFGSLNYVIPPSWVWRNIRRCLLPGGRFFIVVYGPRYKKRESHIVNQLKVAPTWWTAKGAWYKKQLENAGLINVEYRGFHALPDRYSEAWASKGSPRFNGDSLKKYLIRESWWLRGPLANLGYYIILTGERRPNETA